MTPDTKRQMKEIKEGSVVTGRNPWCKYIVEKVNKTTAWLRLHPDNAWEEMHGGKNRLRQPLYKGVRISTLRKA